MTMGASLLLVDDLPANLFALECILAPLGHRMVRAGSGQEALRRVLDEDFAAILLDLRLGDMSGVEVLQLLRSRERSRRTPVILLTAEDGDAPTLQPAYALGMVDYVRKPLVSDLLRAKVALCVELHLAREALRRQELRVRELSAQLQAAHREVESLRTPGEAPSS
ncbi:response regulator [Pyxidicoccus fallax]|uniref:Response regulator n=1 Tax=Pyxidicoccus fallax TaxID=394095 RepID=A0A848LPX7_9BACT|nr:response regulator [Pyxidicoccus fallax]NMO19729.1 response regulator [Pyxidicoccus fallax]NPC84424.1 response regulator [Pyxidicoccus fallax]